MSLVSVPENYKPWSRLSDFYEEVLTAFAGVELCGCSTMGEQCIGLICSFPGPHVLVSIILVLVSWKRG